MIFNLNSVVSCMSNNMLASKYMQYNKILLSTLHTDKKIIEVSDSEKSEELSYTDFCFYIANYFDLIPDFVEKSVVFLNNFDVSDEILEINVESKKTNGSTANYVYLYIKLNDTDFLLSVKEQKIVENAQLDQMTNANQK